MRLVISPFLPLWQPKCDSARRLPTAVSARPRGQKKTTNPLTALRIGVQPPLSSPKQEVQTPAKTLCWTPPLRCDEVATEPHKESESALDCEGLLISRCQPKGVGYGYGNDSDNRENGVRRACVECSLCHILCHSPRDSLQLCPGLSSIWGGGRWPPLEGRAAGRGEPRHGALRKSVMSLECGLAKKEPSRKTCSLNYEDSP